MSRKIGGKTSGKTYLTIVEVAKLLGVHPRTVYHWIEKKAVLSKSNEMQIVKGIIPSGSEEMQLSFFIDPFSGYHYFPEDEVKEFVKKLVKV